MNMQTIQIMILLLDGFIKLAPWRNVTQVMCRIGCAFSASLTRGRRIVIAILAGLGLTAIVGIFGPSLVAGYLVGVMPLHTSRIGLVFGYGVSGFCVAVALWSGVWWRGRRHLSPFAM